MDADVRSSSDAWDLHVVLPTDAIEADWVDEQIER